MRKQILFPLILVMLASACSAAVIGMKIEMNTPPLITENSFNMSITVTNTGDEPAYDVQLTLYVPDGFTTKDVFVGTLYPNRPFKGQFEISATTTTPGRYPFILKTHYADGNGYPFSTIAPKFIDYIEHAATNTRATLESIELGVDESKDMKLTIVNTDQTPHSYRVRLYTPDEITSETLEQTVDVPATSQKELSFKMKPFGALPNSAYAVSAVIDYDTSMEGSSLRRSTITTGVVKVVKAQTVQYVPTWLPIAVLVLLIGAFLVLQLRKRGSEQTLAKEAKEDQAAKDKKRKGTE